MTEQQLLTNEHSSLRLARRLVERHGVRPSKCHAHAIVAGRHKFAAPTRALMATLRIGIDDPDNGCWLPENTAATPHPAFLKTPPHSRIHRAAYFQWLRIRLGCIRVEAAFRTQLNIIARMIQNGDLPPQVMAKGSKK